jgi:hypothetical protein
MIAELAEGRVGAQARAGQAFFDRLRRLLCNRDMFVSVR